MNKADMDKSFTHSRPKPKTGPPTSRSIRGVTVGHECPGKTKWVDPKEVRGTVAKFRKKPVVIEAIVAAHDGSIKTLAGIMSFKEGDFIVTGVEGERYPCTPDIFRETYEPVDYDAEVLLRIADEREKSGAFLEYEFLDYPMQEELKVDPLAEENEKTESEG